MWYPWPSILRVSHSSGNRISISPDFSIASRPILGKGESTRRKNSSLILSREIFLMFSFRAFMAERVFPSMEKPSLAENRAALIILSPSSLKRSMGLPIALIVPFFRSLRPSCISIISPSCTFEAKALMVKSLLLRSSSKDLTKHTLSG